MKSVPTMKEWMAMGAVCGLWAPLLVYGQEPRGITDLITPPAVEQGAPAGSYALSGFERVSLYSGKLHFALPLLSVGGRGETGYSMMLPLDRGWQVRPYNDVNGNVNFFAVTALTVGTHWWSDRPVPLFSPGVVVSRRSGSGLEECAGSSGTYWYRSVLTRLTFIGADGSETELVDEPSGGTAGMYGNCDINETRKLRPGPFVSRDGSAMTFVPATDKQVEDVRDPSPGLDLGLVTGTLYFRDGRRFQVENGTVTAIHDRNGNKVTLVYNAIGQLVSVTDALGRVVTIAYDFETESFLISWSRTGAPGGKRTIKVQCGQMETALGPGVSIQSYSDVFAQFGGSSLPINPQVVKSVELPNGQSYSFKYNSAAELAEVRLPTGGAYRYQWTGVGVYNGLKPFLVRRVTSRQVISEGETVAGATSYQYDDLGTTFVDGRNYPTTKVTVTPTGMGVSGSQVHYFYGNVMEPDQEQSYEIPMTYWRQAREFKTEERSQGGAVLRTTTQTWSQRSCGSGEACPTTFPQFDPRLSSRTVTMNDTGDGVNTTFTYDRYNNETGWVESDAPGGSGTSVVRWGTTTYQGDASYTAPPIHLRALPLVSSTYGSTLAERTEIQYDGSMTIDNPGMTGYTAPPLISGQVRRGNPTLVRAFFDATGSNYATTTRTFDIAGNVRSVSDPRGKTTTVLYDSTTGYGFPVQITNAANHATTMSWNMELGRPVWVVGPNAGETTSYAYDAAEALDRVTQVTRPIGSTTYLYNDAGRTRTVRVAQNSCATGQVEEASEVHDGLGRPVRTIQLTDAGQIEATIEYDGAGRRWRRSFPFSGTANAWTEVEYDALGRPVVERVKSEGNGAVTSYVYLGRKTTVTDAAGRSRENLFDAAGRLAQVREAPSTLGYLTNYSYDGAGRLIGVSQSGQTRSFTYDLAGRLLHAVNPETGPVNYEYDDASNLVKRADALGVITCMGYKAGSSCGDPAMAHDGLNRVVKKTYSTGAPAVVYSYDSCGSGVGRLCGVMVTGGTGRTFAYNAAGWVTSSTQTTDGQSYVFSYQYNDAGELETMTLPSGRSVKECYDRAGRSKSVTGSKSGEANRTYVSQVSYDAGGGVAQMQMGNGRWESRTYNGRKQVTGVKLGAGAGGGELLTVGLGYGTTANNGNVLSQTIGRAGGFSVSQVYEYDEVNRLKKVMEGAEYRNMMYSATGNVWVDTTSANWTPGSFTPRTGQWYEGATNRLANAGMGVVVNGVGNLTGIGGYGYGYDAENRMTSSTIGGVTTSYAYDGDGRRVKKGGTVMVYDAYGRLAAEYGGTVEAGGQQYLTVDHLGSTRAVTNGAGAVTQCRDYLPFGEEIGGGVNGRGACYGAAAEVRWKFTGKERDAETGLDYFGARYMSAAQGRFTSPDAPFADQHAEDPQSWNLYSYVRNNPLRYTDPTGRCLRPNETLASCGDYLIGGAKAIGNIPSDIVNAPNRLTNLLISPFTDFQFPDLLPSTFQAANSDQAQGIEAMQVSLVATGVGEAATAGAASRTISAIPEAAPTGGRLGSASTRAQNAAIADSLESRGFTVTGGGGRFPEEHLKGPGGGRKGGTFVDVTAVRDGKTVRVQTIDTRADGVTPTTREANATARVRAQQQRGDHTVLIPKRK